MIYFVTTNKNKFIEAKEIFNNFGLNLEILNIEYKEIQATTLEEVVVEALNNIREKNIFIEDAGLFINSLKGFPGVYSRYVEDTIGNQGILKLMKDVKDRDAVFKSVVGYKNREIKIFVGEVEGTIAQEIRGEGGFGYDPIFLPKGFNKTFAEDIHLKMKISHRKRALEKLAKYLGGYHGKNTC
jgi:XTP/dITP diphosphohydrolase